MDLSNGNEEYFKKFLSFEILQNVMGSDHGLIYHNRKFFANNLENSFEPIYYDGMIEIFSNPKKKSQIFKDKKYNFNNLFYYLSKIDDIEKFRSDLINIFSEKNMQSIFNNTNFNTKVSYSEFWKSISYIIENLNYFFDQYKLNKNNLSEVNFSNKIENYNKFLDENYDNLIFYQINFDSLLNENKFVFKECFNSKCELKSKDSKFLTNLILGRNIDRKKYFIYKQKLEITRT